MTVTAIVHYLGSSFEVEFPMPRAGCPVEDVHVLRLVERDDEDCPLELPDPLPDSVYQDLLEAAEGEDE